MSDILAGKVVVVTSASSGLGRAASLSAARHGAKAVLVADITETPREGGRPTVAAATALGVAAQFVRTDVTKRGDLDARVAASVELAGSTSWWQTPESPHTRTVPMSPRPTSTDWSR